MFTVKSAIQVTKLNNYFTNTNITIRFLQSTLELVRKRYYRGKKHTDFPLLCNYFNHKESKS